MPPAGRSVVVVLASILLLALPPTSRPVVAVADHPWVEVKSPHFTVLSDAGERQARRIAWQFEQVRAVLQKLWPWAHVTADKPVMVFAARNEQTLKSLAPEFWERKGDVRPASVFVSGRDRHYIAVRCDVDQPDSLAANPYFQTYWSYVFLVLEWSFEKPLPLWFARGLSDVFANTIVRDKDIQVGRVVPWHLRELNARPLLPLATVLQVDRQSRYLTRPDDSQAFHASAWAFIHYLAFGEHGANLPSFNRLAEALGSGRESAFALREIYGDPARLESAVRNYVGRSLFVYQLVKLDLNVSADGFTPRSVSTAEAAALQAALHVTTGRLAEARKLGQEAMRADGTLPGPHEAEGLRCDTENKTEEARAAYATAVELGSTNFYVHYRHAQLLWRPSPDPDTLGRIEKSLLRAAELNGDFAPAYSYLADVRIDQGQTEAAVALARRAVGLEPRDSYHRCTLARALARASKREEARQESQKALALAKTASERQRAEEILAYINTTPERAIKQTGDEPPAAVFQRLTSAHGLRYETGLSVPSAVIQFYDAGIDFTPWLKSFVATVRSHWEVPQGAMHQQGRVAISFDVTRGGTIEQVTVDAASGVADFDTAARLAIARSSPAQPLPAGYPSDRCHFVVTFHYNVPPR